jgi:serine/threonine-protein kinase
MEFTPTQILAGDQIGPYLVVRRLGAGGMGEVYLARHRHLGRDAAVKVLLPEISMNQTMVARFFTEARATAQLRHPNIVEIFDCDVLPNGRAYIVMEYLPGESLRTTLCRVKKLAPDYRSIAAFAGMVADALQAAHANGIVHRDLKPDNTFLTLVPNRRDALIVKVLDFGIAKLLSAKDTGQDSTRTGSLLGTPLYMSPEQCRGIPTIGHWADIYSLGCVIFEMVTGRPPFVSEAPGDLLMAHISEKAPLLSRFQPDVPPEIESLVAQMLAKDPALRQQSMGEVAGLIEDFLGVRIAEFNTVLRRPAGFVDSSPPVATAILTPAHVPSTRLTPTPPKREDRSNRNFRTPHSNAGEQPRTPRAGAARTPSRFAGTTERRPARNKWPVRLALVSLALALAGGASYLLTRSRSEELTRRQQEPLEKPEASKPTEAKSTARPELPAQVTVQVSTTPRSAQVWFAGESAPRGATPWNLVVPKSGAQLDIVLKADGFVDKSLTIDANQDRDLNITLEPRKEAPDRRSVRTGAAGKGERKRSEGQPESSDKFKAVGD